MIPSGRYLLLLPLLLRGQPNQYVDARLCANCHPKIAQTYALTGMARSFYRLQPKTAIEDLNKGNSYYHQPSATWYAMLRRDGKYYQRRWRLGTDNQESSVQELQIDYVMGSGNHVRTYLHQTARGTLIEMPLAWYSEKGGTWAMNPGHDQPYALPPRTIAYECMFCHNAYPKIPTGRDEPGSEAVYSEPLPEGIDCQRCHGPGRNHIRAASSGNAAVETIRRAIVNPARLSGARQMEVCLQCHLETTSRQLPHSIQRYGRAPFSYQPGEPLGSFEIFFDRASAGQPKDDFEIVNSAYRLRQSQCFLRSAGKLTCTTCHNPHDILRGAEAALHYNRVCAGCHDAPLHEAVRLGRHPAAPDCVACHMPKRRAQDVIHAVMTDHLIQRRPPAGDLLAAISERQDTASNQYRGEVIPYYPSPLQPTGENALYAAVAQVTQRSNLAAGLPRLAAEIAKQKPARPEFYIELGQAWLSVQKPANAIAPLEEAVKREPDSPVALLNLADAFNESGQSTRAIAVLNRALKTAPGDPLLWYQLGIASTSAGREIDAIAAFEKCVALDPGLAEAHNLLGAALASAGDLDRGGKEMQAALQINPDLPEALGNLGHLLAMRGDLTQAASSFARSVQLKPDDADVRTNYAVTLAGLNRFEDAQRQIDAALKADPASPDAHNFKGNLLERQARHGEALNEFLEAIRLRPDYDRAHLSAALLLAARGDRIAAEQHLRQAAKSSNPNIQRQAAAELQKIGR